MTKASQADQKADQNTQGLNSLRSAVSNLDDYKLQSSAPSVRIQPVRAE